MKTCSIDGCERSVVARGWCSKHYGRWQQSGSPIPLHRPTYGQGVPNRAMNGYLRVWDPTHPLASKDGTVYVHRKVAWDAGIFDDPDLHVHHINGDRRDNSLANLAVTTNEEHARQHARERGTITNQYGTWPVHG